MYIRNQRGILAHPFSNSLVYIIFASENTKTMHNFNRYTIAGIIKFRVIIVIMLIVPLIELTVSGKNTIYNLLS